MDSTTIRESGRNAQGVRLLKMEPRDRVVAAVVIALDAEPNGGNGGLAHPFRNQDYLLGPPSRTNRGKGGATASVIPSARKEILPLGAGLSMSPEMGLPHPSRAFCGRMGLRAD